MQIRIREKRYYKVYRQFSRAAAPSFRGALVALLCSSCSLFVTKNSSENDFKKICLSAEGRGRLEHRKGRHLFEFESLLSRDERKWSLGLDLPVVGQEVLHFKYPRLDNSVTAVSGTFANRLKLDVKSKAKKKELKKFFSMMGELLSMIDSRRLKVGWSIKQGTSNFILVKKLNKNEVFHFEALDASSYYERLNLTLKKRDKFKKLHSVMKMNLFLSQCSAKAE